MDYCFKQSEFAENPQALASFEAICNGDRNAVEFLWRVWNFFHLMDDLVDKDKPVSLEEAARELFMFTQAIALNPFFQAYKVQLLPFILNACNGWVIGDQWAASQLDSERRVSPALKCSDFNLYSYVAFLTGGWDNMRSSEPKFRVYDKE